MKDFRKIGGLCGVMLAVVSVMADSPQLPVGKGEAEPLTQEPPVPIPQEERRLPMPAPEDLIEPEGLTSAEWADSIRLLPDDRLPLRKFTKLTDEDFQEVAEELGVEVAAIKAVVDIEAGRAHEGFYKPGQPLINFDLSMYRKFAPRHGVSLSKAKKKAPEIFARPNTRKYGSYQGAQYARLDKARGIDEPSALEATFWGMFQIGGFNWKLCGCSSVEEFVELMSRSERDQLELFARLITNCGMLESLQNKQWLKFALKYNGPRARARGYHTRMASAYARYKAAEK